MSYLRRICEHGTGSLGESVWLSRRGNPWLLCAFDIRGYEKRRYSRTKNASEAMRVRFSHVIEKWSRAKCLYGGGTEHRRFQGTPGFSYRLCSSGAEHRRRHVAKGESEVSVHLEICLVLGANYMPGCLGTPKHPNKGRCTLSNYRYLGICAR